MERKTFSVIFYLRRTRMNRNGEAPIVMRITMDGTRADAVIKKTINPDQWDSGKGKASEKNNKRGYELNLYMDAIRCKITHIQRELELDMVKNIIPQMILNRWLERNEEKRRTILETFREHNETCLKLTAEFIRFTYKRDNFYLDEMNRQFIEDYEFYLKTIRKCNHNTTTKYLKNFKKHRFQPVQRVQTRHMGFHLPAPVPDYLRFYTGLQDIRGHPRPGIRDMEIRRHWISRCMVRSRHPAGDTDRNIQTGKRSPAFKPKCKSSRRDGFRKLVPVHDRRL